MLTENPTSTNLLERNSMRDSTDLGKPKDISVASAHLYSNSLTTLNQVERSPPVSKRWPVWFTLTLVLLAGWLNALPWLYEGYTWSAWLGLAVAMQLATSSSFGSRFWVTWFWCSCVLGAAFHWSPAAMAYTLSSGFALGLLVALPLIIWDGLRMALGFWLATKLTVDTRYYWLVAAFTTIALEYTMPGVFPWKIGLTQLSNPWLIQGIDLFGPSFSTFVAFAIAGALQIGISQIVNWLTMGDRSVSIATSTSNRSQIEKLAFSPVTVTLVCIALYNTIAWQHWSQTIRSSKKIKVGLVQVDPSYVESTDNARKQTAMIAEQVDFVCWPESSAGNYDLHLNNLADDAQTFLMSREPERGLRPWPSPKCELLVGGKNYVGNAEAPDELYVTAMLIDSQETIKARHNKRFLMPFGEYVPGEKYIPGLAELFDMSEFVQAGHSVSSIETNCGARIGTMLCYEDMVPQAAREMVFHGSNLLVSLVNGSAFESRFTLYQHRLIAHLRAIECRRYFLRCAATGETCVINPLGEIEARLPVQIDGSLVCDVGLIDGKTLYSRFPWLFPMIGCGVLVSFLLNAQQRR